MWHRVFGRSAVNISPALLTEHLHALGLAVTPHFKGDDLGWTSGELHLATGSPVMLDRWLTETDDLRDDLNGFAAELETFDYSPNAQPLMERVIQTSQMITLRKPVDGPDEVTLEKVLLACCQFLASHCDGIYQIDSVGWFSADGTMLVQEY
ncbi:hypothetical protein BH11PLA2_BH11PLA2_09520 [soil metagenome]